MAAAGRRKKIVIRNHNKNTLASRVVGYFLFSVKVRSTYFVLAPLALSIIVEQLAKSQKDITGGWNGLFVDRITLTVGPFIEYSLVNDIPMYYFVFFITLLSFILIKWLMASKFGKIFVCLWLDFEYLDSQSFRDLGNRR